MILTLGLLARLLNRLVYLLQQAAHVRCLALWVELLSVLKLFLIDEVINA